MDIQAEPPAGEAVRGGVSVCLCVAWPHPFSADTHTHVSTHTPQHTHSFFAELEPDTGALVLKHANAEGNVNFWASKAAAPGTKGVRVKVLKDRPAFGVFDGETPVWVSDQ